MDNLITHLNVAQQQAVTALPANLLVLAGAGSGKTRVLVHRIAWLINHHNIAPYNILAVTFTNKAANEMRSRIEQLLGTLAPNTLWVGTFHSLAHRLLRLHWHESLLPQHFQIVDSEDQLRLIRRVMKNLSIDEARWPVKQVQSFINNQKDQGQRAHQLSIDQHDLFNQTMQRIYQAYENTCQQCGLVDFAELLLRVLELWQRHASILKHYQQRFGHILVDEFQDTNAIQYNWLKQLACDSAKVMVVGDDDQSIYSWRGARVENIRRFRQEFINTKTILLQQNYRSTGNILRAANALISHNNDRLGKKLWTSAHDGEPIILYSAFNELDEARFVVDRIQYWQQQEHSLKNMAILYRSNAQSRVLEEALIQAGIYYHIYGGMRFFERAEIKDALAYLRLMANVDDDGAFERVVNLPPRGIGERTLQSVRALAREHKSSLWQAAIAVVKLSQLSQRACHALENFLQLITNLISQTQKLPLAALTTTMLQQSGLLNHYQQVKGEKGQAKVENLEELITATRQFDHNDDNTTALIAFLSHAALESGESQAKARDDSIQMMTLHSAKGLEFSLVFLTGVEEGLFPHQMSLNEPNRLAEERRLCYVGITRAKRQLYVCYAKCRRLHGRERLNAPSRFITELPRQCLREIQTLATSVRPSSYHHHYCQKKITFNTSQSHESGLKVGLRVYHKTFGEGIITNFDGQGQQARVQVRFTTVGSKWLVIAYAKLQT